MSDTDSEASAIVIDNGSYKCKAGFSGDDAPRAVFPPIVGSPSCDPSAVGSKYKDTYVGDEAVVKKKIFSLDEKSQDPDEVNWDDMEKVWHHLFYNELRASPEEYGVLITEKPFRSKGYREKVAEIMFEKFNIQSFYADLEAVFCLYGAGLLTGTVLESGHTASYTVPIQDGYAVPGAIECLNIAGKQMTDYLCKLLQSRGYNFMSSSDKKIVNDMKEKLGVCAIDFDSEMAACERSDKYDKSYDLPDGKSINIRNEHFRLVEPMFQPSLIGIEEKGAHQILHDSIMKCGDLDIKNMFSNIVLAGSSTMFPNFPQRMKKEVSNLVSSDCSVKITAVPERKLSAWIGGSIFASTSSAGASWISKTAYDEHGSNIVHS